MALRSPLHQEHLRRGARLVDFAGWSMPIQYSGVVAEHLAVRNAAGLFDVSHLGKLVLEGSAVAALDAFLPGKVAALEPWQAAYNLVLSAEGGVIDDVFVYRRPDSLVVVPNAANAGAVLAHLRAHLPGEIAVADARDRWAILALQGPASRPIMAELQPAANQLKLHRFFDTDLSGTSVQAARTGYTGEYGFEFFVSHRDAPALWNLLLEAGEPHGLVPAGLGARDTLRLEMGYPLHGQDISLETNPVEAGMEWVIAWDKPRFLAKEPLEKIRRDGPSRRLVGLVARGREIPRTGFPVSRDDREVGKITSGNFSPVLRTGIALAYVEIEAAQPGTMLTVDVRGRGLQVEVTRPPFVKKG